MNLSLFRFEIAIWHILYTRPSEKIERRVLAPKLRGLRMGINIISNN